MDNANDIWEAAWRVPDDAEGEDITLASGEIVTLPPKVAAARRAFQRRDDRLRDTYAIDPWVLCVFCEDTGRIKLRDDFEDMAGPAGEPCFCQMGEATAFRDKREARWREVVPKRMQRWTLDSCPNESLVIKLYDWTKNEPMRTGTGLVLLGDIGRGKTGAAVGLLRHYHDLGHSVMYAQVEDLLSTTRDGMNDRDENVPYAQRPIVRARTVEMLLLDDVGSERITDWSSQAIDHLIRQRYDEGKPTLITSNLNGAEFARRVGPRLMSRFTECMKSVVVESGHDYRRE